ncbi:MAG: PPE domain-containing protein [Pseudonocardiaceae bacterium]
MRTTTCENYGIYQHETIKYQMENGAGPDSQGDVMSGWNQLSGRLTDIRRYIESAISGVQATQQGAAADAAVKAMVPMGSWVDEAQRLANDTRDRIGAQIDAFNKARGSIPEVPPEPRGGGWKEIPGIDSFTTSDQEVDEAFNAEQERQARAVMEAYQNGTNERVVNVPHFAPPPTGEPDLSVPIGRRSEVGGFPGDASGGSGGGSLPGAQTSLAGVGADGTAQLPAAPTGPQGGSGFVDPERGGGRPVAPATPTAPGVVPGGAAPVRPAAGGPRGPGSGRVGAGRSGPGGGGAGMRGGPGAGGFRPQGGGPGGGFGLDRGGFGPTGSPESAAARAAGAGSGAAGAGAGRGAANAGGVPFGGMGGGRGDEDSERQRPSYLIEPDSNRLIGELPWTAPAVIGEEPPDYDESDRR